MEYKESSDRVKLDFDSSDDVHLLVISDANPDDAGEYIVKATNEGGDVSATVNIAVSVPEEIKVLANMAYLLINNTYMTFSYI